MHKSLAFAAAVAATLLASSAPAQAEEEECPNGRLCVWSHYNFSGEFKEVHVPLGACLNPQATWPNGTKSRVSSLSNRLDHFQLQAYDNGSCAGQPYGLVKPGQRVAQVSDQAQSLRVTPVCDPGRVCFYEKADYSGQSWYVPLSWSSRCYSAELEGAEPPRSAYNMLNTTANLFFTRGFCLGSKYPLQSGEFGAFKEPVRSVTR
ncbi:peptidase inhibitor family I36 protein [Streptomyces griseofuscus]|uniref:peptidase inhibitor family I36 protein n=1 Tax=Streptomyces griseofuscus TaxID=146922 RepID=UPI0036A4D62B